MTPCRWLHIHHRSVTEGGRIPLALAFSVCFGNTCYLTYSYLLKLCLHLHTDALLRTGSILDSDAVTSKPDSLVVLCFCYFIHQIFIIIHAWCVFTHTLVSWLKKFFLLKNPIFLFHHVDLLSWLLKAFAGIGLTYISECSPTTVGNSRDFYYIMESFSGALTNF